MFDAKVFKELIAKEDKLHINDPTIVDCWEEQLQYILLDLDGLVRYIESDITENEFSSLSSIFDEIVENTQSRSFIAALKRAAERFPEECERYNILEFIDDAEKLLNEPKEA
ncbi:MAG: hypothetical protein ACOX8U_06930 [Bradymonadia bacterium]|jgi:hypothetical protein